MDAVKKIGLLKMDFLGLRTLTVIDNALKIIKRTHGQQIDIDNVSLDDSKTFAMLKRGDTIGVFQLESAGMRSLLRDLKPGCFEDIINLLALYRPGPLGSNMVKDFVERKHGEREISYLHPRLEPILKETHGIIVYQEQVMRIASELAGFSMAEADILRGAMSKKKPHVLAEQREKFIGGAVDHDIEADTSGRIFDLMAHFAGYGFNKSHSSAYAVISYQTAYLKANYPVEFMASLLTSIMGNKDKVPQYVNECRRLGIEILPPDVNESFRGFTVVGDSKIRFGLSAVRNVGDNVIEAIIRGRKEETFKSIYDFCKRVDLSVINKRALESLIKCGAFDSCGGTRKHLLSIYEDAVETGLRKQKDDKSGQFSFFDVTEGKKNHVEQNESSFEEFPKERLLAYEKEMLGLYVSDHPLLGLEHALKEQTDMAISQLKEQKDGSIVWIGGIISKTTKVTTKKGDLMLFLTVEDLEGSVEVVVFPNLYQKSRELILEDQPLRIRGRIDIKEDEAKLIAQEIEALQGKKKGPLPIYIQLYEEKFSPQLLERLKRIIISHPGASPVFLQVKGKKDTTTLRLNDGYKVTSNSGFFAELKELLGEDAIFLQN